MQTGIELLQQRIENIKSISHAEKQNRMRDERRVQELRKKVELLEELEKRVKDSLSREERRQSEIKALEYDLQILRILATPPPPMPKPKIRYVVGYPPLDNMEFVTYEEMRRRFFRT